MTRIKLIATDLDGTFLVNHAQSVPENVKALKEAQAAGIPVCACTARNWTTVRDIINKYGFDQFCVTNNGVSVVDSHTGLHRYRNRMDPELVRTILDIATQGQAPFLIVGHEKFYFLKNHLNQRFEQRRAWMQRMLGRGEDIFYAAQTLDELVEACGQDAEKIEWHLGPENTRDGVFDQLSDCVDVEITASSSRESYLEITAKDATKGESLAVLAHIYDVQPEEVLALGDNLNDIHMIMWAGTGVAMGDGDARLQAVADWVTTDSTAGGWAKAVREIALGG